MTFRLTAIGIVVLSGAAHAQQPQLVLERGQDVDGFAVYQVNGVQVDNDGVTLIDARDYDQGDLAIRDGSVYLHQGQITGAGSPIEEIFHMDLHDDDGAIFTLCLGPQQSGCDASIFLDDALLLSSGDPASAPGLPAGSEYSSLGTARVNDLKQVVLLTTLRDDSLGYRGALVRADVSPAGAVVSETIVAIQGALAPDAGGWTFGTTSEFEINNRGDLIFNTTLGASPERQAVYVNSELIATTYAPSPIPGEIWLDLYEGQLDINNAGDFVFSGVVDGPAGTNELIVKNGVKFRQSGDTLPAIGPGSVLTVAVSRQMWIDDLGEVLWVGEWTDGSGGNGRGYFIDDELIVEDGVTTFNGSPILLPASPRNLFALSRNGRFVAFHAFWDGTNAAGVLLIDRRPLGQGFCVGADNSTGRGAVLSAAGSTVLADADLTLTAEDLPPGVPGLFFFGPSQVQAPFGDGFRCVGGAVRRIQPLAFANAAGLAVRALNFAAPYAAGLLPGSVSFQLWYRDPMGPGGSGFNTSMGLEIVFS